MTVQEAIKYWKLFLKEIAFLKQEHSSVDWEEQEQATKMAIEALEKQSKLERVIEKLENEVKDLHEDCNYIDAYKYEEAIKIIKEGMG